MTKNSHQMFGQEENAPTTPEKILATPMHTIINISIIYMYATDVMHEMKAICRAILHN